jgi:hypothetical protein
MKVKIELKDEHSETEQAGAVDGPVLAQAVLARGKGRADFVVTPLAFRALARPVPVLVPQLTGDVLLLP